MKQAVAIGLALFGFLILMSGDSQAEETSKDGEQPQKPALVDPLPGYELTQAHIVEAVTEAYSDGKKDKLTSVLVKSSSASPALRAYFLATLRSVPQRLKEDAEFSKQFAAYEQRRIVADRENQKDLASFIKVARVLQVAIASLIPYVGRLVLAASDALYGWISDETIDGGADSSKARRAADQILPGYEGVQLRRGVSIEAGADVPNVTRADQQAREAIRRQWFEQSQTDEDFLSLPAVADRQAFRFSPTYAEFRRAADEIRSGQ